MLSGAHVPFATWVEDATSAAGQAPHWEGMCFPVLTLQHTAPWSAEALQHPDEIMQWVAEAESYLDKTRGLHTRRIGR